MKKINSINIDGAPAGSIRTNSGSFVNVFDTDPDTIILFYKYLLYSNNFITFVHK